MFKVILVLVILVLIVILRYRLSENFATLSNLVEGSGVDSIALLDNAKNMLNNNDVPLGSNRMNDEILSMLVSKTVVHKDEDESNDDLFQSDPLYEDVEEPDFYIKIMDQNHKIFTESSNQRMLCDNLMNELRKLSKNSTPISVLARKYVFNNIEDPVNSNANNSGTTSVTSNQESNNLNQEVSNEINREVNRLLDPEESTQVVNNLVTLPVNNNL